jgi:hypothetical protein
VVARALLRQPGAPRNDQRDDALNATTMTLCWGGIFFFASAGASAGTGRHEVGVPRVPTG